nr:immunoglobulin heavy chain junction region [Mus musculus]
LCGLLLFPPN